MNKINELNELERTTGRTVSPNQVKILNKGNQYIIIEKINNVYRTSVGYRSYAEAEKKGYKMLKKINEGTTSADIAKSGSVSTKDVLDNVKSRIKSIQTSRLEALLDDEGITQALDNVSTELRIRFIQSITDELQSRQDIADDVKIDQNSVNPALKEDKELFYRGYIPSNESLFYQHNIQKEINEYVQVDLDSASSTLLTEASDAYGSDSLSTDSVVLSEALSAFGYQVPQTGLNEFYDNLKEQDFLLESKVQVYKQTKAQENKARDVLTKYANDASDFNSDKDNLDNRAINPKTDIELYRDLIKKMKSRSLALELDSIDADWIDDALDEHKHFIKHSSLKSENNNDSTLIGMYIKSRELSDKLIVPVQEALDKELDGHCRYDTKLFEFHERRDTLNGVILIKKEMKPTHSDIYKQMFGKKYASFSFNVVTANEAKEAKDLSSYSSLSAEADEITDSDVFKAELTLHSRVGKKEWVLDKTLNPELCTCIETRKFDIFHNQDRYRVLPKGKADEIKVEKEAKKAQALKDYENHKKAQAIQASQKNEV